MSVNEYIKSTIKQVVCVILSYYRKLCTEGQRKITISPKSQSRG